MLLSERFIAVTAITSTAYAAGLANGGRAAKFLGASRLLVPSAAARAWVEGKCKIRCAKPVRVWSEGEVSIASAND
jgi:hypothetical protein